MSKIRGKLDALHFVYTLETHVGDDSIEQYVKVLRTQTYDNLVSGTGGDKESDKRTIMIALLQ